MKNANTHTSTKAKKTCAGCCERRALYRYRGRTRWNAQHDLCFRCWRSIMDRLQATRTAHLSRAEIVARARARKAHRLAGVSETSNPGVFRMSA